MPRKSKTKRSTDKRQATTRRSGGLPPLTGVAKGSVGTEVQSFVNNDVASMTVDAESDGTYTITPQ